MMGSVSGTLATMGCAVPYAIAAKFAHPERPVIALVGDGAMQMNGLGELITIAKYWRDWSDPRVIVMVLNNRELAYVTWEDACRLETRNGRAASIYRTCPMPTSPGSWASMASASLSRARSAQPGTARSLPNAPSCSIW
ncbi:thiamine pyrophosphate-dependent enzyme [Bosea sp. RCC_152_1]|uniref:thiamine pyrophosphate-dependent enzyme n=1 Tax=Bosea sp. RCC_152_1 TaxID=3239228 RepID=UPI0035237824